MNAIWLLAALPVIVVWAITFVKFSVVFATLQKGLGGAVPPASVGLVLALLLSAFVVWPIVRDGDVASAKNGAAMQQFLESHTQKSDVDDFRDVGHTLNQKHGVTAAPNETIVLSMAYAAGQLKTAFQMAFFLFMPFFVMELVVAVLLQAAGLTALSPTWVSLPFKLLLFILADGWRLLLRGLLLSYN